MNDYEKIAAELAKIVDSLQTMSVPDADLDGLIYDATEKLSQARELASERA